MRDYKIMFFTDDDADDLHLMKEVADSLGHDSQLFHDPAKMLAQLNGEETKPDIIFLDIRMPLIDGFEVLEKLRSSDFNDIPVVIHTANSDEKSISKCFELGANYYITKAYNFQNMKSAMEHAINKDWTIFKPTREDFLYIHQ